MRNEGDAQKSKIHIQFERRWPKMCQCSFKKTILSLNRFYMNKNTILDFYFGVRWFENHKE